MAEIIPIRGPRPPKKNHHIVADRSTEYYEENLGLIGAVVGAQRAMRARSRPNIGFVNTAYTDTDHLDGSVQVLRGDPKKPVVVVSDNVAEFFTRNGRTERRAIQDAALYATATGFAAICLELRGAGLSSGGMNEKLWNHIGINEPRKAAPYRFAAGVMDELGRGIEPRSVVPSGKSLEIHVASFVDPLQKAAIKDLAAPYFKTH